MQEVRRRCLATIIKLLYFCQPALLTALLADVNIASFLSSLLASRDWHVVAAALQMAEILMDKSADSYAQLFLKEGVVHAMDQLAQQAPQQAQQPSGRWLLARLRLTALVGVCCGYQSVRSGLWIAAAMICL
jgi:hypothetical protein